jgi:hypothetical protein
MQTPMKKAAQKMGGKEADDVSGGGQFEQCVRKTSIASSSRGQTIAATW